MAATPPRLKVACVLERYYNFQLESTLSSTGFEDCLDELSFVKEVKPTDDMVATSVSAADRAWAAQHISVWRQCAESDAPILIFQDDVAFSSSSVFTSTESLVTAAESATSNDDERATRILVLDAAVPDGESARLSISAAGGLELMSVQSAPQVTAYVLWPAAARTLLAALPLDGSVSAFLGRQIAERSLGALMASPALTATPA